MCALCALSLVLSLLDFSILENSIWQLEKSTSRNRFGVSRTRFGNSKNRFERDEKVEKSRKKPPQKSVSKWHISGLYARTIFAAFRDENGSV